MSDKVRPRQYADAKSVIVEGFDGNAIVNEGLVVPVDGTAGYTAGSLFFKRGGTIGAQLYINQGSNTSCAFVAVGAGPVSPTANRIARGQLSTVSASDTVVTGLALVVTVVACLDSTPTTGCSWASASIGDQAGTPAAGSILVQTWKPTTAGAAGNPDVIAATTFTKKVNWIAIGS